MSFKPTLDRIEQRLREKNLSPSAASKLATGNGDTIRNWQRSVAENTPVSPRLKTLRAVAEALEVTLEWLLYGDQAIYGPGMADQPIKAFAPKDDQPIQAAAVSAIISRNPHLSAQLIELDYPEFFIAKGDIAICDPRLENMSPGSIVICNHVDDLGHATKILRRFAPPWLMGNGGDGLALAMTSDQANVVMTIDGIIRLTD